MKEDYLWDKTGEPDPEIQELERVLGTLRYQPRPLDIPAGLAPERKSAFLPRLLAIAATVAIMLLGVGLWFGLQRQQPAAVSKVENTPGTTNGGDPLTGLAPKKIDGPAGPMGPQGATGPIGSQGPVALLPAIEPSNKRIRHRVNPGALSHEPAGNRRTRLNTPQLSAEERAEAEAVKEQLLLALRVASSKLSFAQKKAQEVNTQNQTHNQHKVG